MTISSASDLDGLRRVGRLVAETLREMREAVRPGVTTAAIDDVGAAYAAATARARHRSSPISFPGSTASA